MANRFAGRPTGPSVRLRGISRLSLPPGGVGIGENGVEVHQPLIDGIDESQARSILATFIREALTDSFTFIGGVTHWEEAIEPKIHTPRVSSYKRVFTKEELNTMDESIISKLRGPFQANEKGETWYARRSRHDKSQVNWEEFCRHHKQEHFQSEAQWCKGVVNPRRAMYWNTSDLEVMAFGHHWNDISMDVVEMRHEIKPKPFMKDRTFPKVLITASPRGSQEFIVISIPLNDFNESKFAVYAKDESLAVAAYVAIELISVAENGEIEWTMATAADAKTSVPRWIQEFFVKRAVRKDVDMYTKWAINQRAVTEAHNPRRQASQSKAHNSSAI